MPIYAVKKNNETVDRLINRSKRQVHNSGVIFLVRAKRYHQKKLSKRIIKNKALKREEYRTKNSKQAYY